MCNLGLFLVTNCVWHGTLLVTQWYRIPLPVQEMWVRSLGQEDPLEEQMAAHFCACLENPMDRGAWRAIVHGVIELDKP